jgi:hypothetical protein
MANEQDKPYLDYLIFLHQERYDDGINLASLRCNFKSDHDILDGSHNEEQIHEKFVTEKMCSHILLITNKHR